MNKVNEKLRAENVALKNEIADLQARLSTAEEAYAKECEAHGDTRERLSAAKEDIKVRDDGIDALQARLSAAEGKGIVPADGRSLPGKPPWGTFEEGR